MKRCFFHKLKKIPLELKIDLEIVKVVMIAPNSVSTSLATILHWSKLFPYYIMIISLDMKGNQYRVELIQLLAGKTD